MSFDELFEIAKSYENRADASDFPDQPAVYEAVLTGSDGGTISLEINNNRITVYKGPRPGCLCSISATPNSIADIVSGKLNPLTAITSGRIKVRGDISALMKLRTIKMK